VSAEQFVVLGLARPRTPWFADVGQWATSAELPIEFVRCVSADEVRARIGSGRAYSALLLDEDSPGVDRDLLALAAESGCASFIVAGPNPRRRWIQIGAVGVLELPLIPDALHAALRTRARSVERVDDLAFRDPTGDSPSFAGRLITVVGPGGSGTSTIAMAIAQGAAVDPRNGGSVALVDACLDSSLALLHDLGDVVPGLPELVEAHRVGSLGPDAVRNMLWVCAERGYDLLAGVRRHRDWTSLRPRATEAAVQSLRQTYAFVVADADSDFEGERETGSLDIEDRNHLARHLAFGADLVVVTGRTDINGFSRMLRLTADLLDHGVDPERIQPVVIGASRAPHLARELRNSLHDLLATMSPESQTQPALLIPAWREMSSIRHDGSALPNRLVGPLSSRVRSSLAIVPTRRSCAVEPVRIPVARLGRAS
jgi:hypothetical protein